jgi:hypothetical protein
MSAALNLLDDLAAIGATIKPEGDRLILRAGTTAIPADLISRIRQAKSDLLMALASCTDQPHRWPANVGYWDADDWRARFDECAGIAEHCGRVSRTEAETTAFETCVFEWLNRNPAPSLPGGCAWCAKRETASAMVLPFGTEPGTHVWLHSECWSDWYRWRQDGAATALRTMGITPEGA